MKQFDNYRIIFDDFLKRNIKDDISSYDVLNIVNYYMGEEEIDAHNLKSNYLKLPQAVCDHNDK